MPETALLKVIIQNPDEIVWQGEAISVSSINSAGPFDILPQHAKFISILENQKISVRTQTQTLSFNFYTSVLSIENNVVTIFANL
ncbi:hypothetical protein A3A70_00950 [candidate division WWE3 bacterium RIFCSPLOWO2_01_FULL_42_11]|uniref:ATP synthase F1 complex delta/epsilon subunit N-terminal domain-containing protein n=1 Tax=candidate division WWE3 bacterium RIFCSPLOWO2_01_FULL_42_11 TaxID=1802627 RepID=A0A1F4VPX0_UNCKA|nr:MAG: hypothetical protein A3A70_00950 [candidate division WWE3 bacterium RIFCSPLOWO2_01_FULL_42_11]